MSLPVPFLRVRLNKALQAFVFLASPFVLVVLQGVAKAQVSIMGAISGFKAVVLSADGRLIAATGDTTLIREPRAKKERLSIRTLDENIEWARFSPDAASLPVLSEEHGLRVWDAKTGQLRFKIGGPSRPDSRIGPRFAPDGKTLAAFCLDSAIRVWDVVTGHESFTVPGSEKNWSAVAFAPAVNVLAWTAGNVVRVRDMDARTGKIASFAHPDFVRTVEFSPDGKTFLTTSNDKTLRLWEVATGKERYHYHQVDFGATVFAPDGNALAFYSPRWGMKLLDARTGVERLHLKPGVSAFAFSRDGKRLVTGHADGTIKLWDSHQGTEVWTHKGHERWVNLVGFLADGHTLVTADWEQDVKYWYVPALAK